jgi:hypothetical protein
MGHGNAATAPGTYTNGDMNALRLAAQNMDGDRDFDGRRGGRPTPSTSSRRGRRQTDGPI